MVRSANFAAYRWISVAKAEFAKDIAAMANAGGGLIVLGIETRRDATIGRDVTSRLRPIPSDLVDISQMEQVAAEWIYASQRTLEIKEWPDSKGKMLISIRVLPVDDAGGLALVRGGLIEERLDRRMIGKWKSASKVKRQCDL